MGAELSHYLGNRAGEPWPKRQANHRHGHQGKTVTTEDGKERSVNGWHEAMNQFAIFSAERFTHPQRKSTPRTQKSRKVLHSLHEVRADHLLERLLLLRG